MAVASFLADKSALARLHHPAVASFLAPLLENGSVATCPLVDMELLYSCRSATEYDTVLAERRGFEQLDHEPADWSRAMEVQRLPRS